MAAETFKLALVLKAFDGVTQPLRQINSALEQVQKPLRNFEKAFGNFKEASGFNRLGESLAGVKDSALKVGGAVFSLASKFALVGGVAAGIFGKIVNDTVESTSKLVDLSNATGAGVESIQRLGYVFEQSGGNTEDFQTGLVKFSKNLGDAKRHAGPLFQLLSKYDKPLLQKMLSTKDTGEALNLYIDKISQAKNDAVRLSMATAAVGKSANVALASAAKDGPESVKKLMAETPGVISKEQAIRIENFGDLLGELGKRIGSIPKPIVAELIPVLDQLGKTFNSFLIGKEQSIKDWAKDFGEKLPGRIELIKSAFVGLWEKMQPIRDAVSWITSDSSRLQAALGVLAAVIAGPVITAMGGLIASIVSFGVALLTTPIGWFGLAVGALVGIGYLVYTKWQVIKDFFITIWDSPAGKLFRFFTPIGMLIEATVEIIKHWTEVKKFFSDIWDNPTENTLVFKQVITWLIEAGQKVYDNWEKVVPLFESLLGPISMIGKVPFKKLFGFGENGEKVSSFSGLFSSPEKSTQASHGDVGSSQNLLDTVNSDGFQSLRGITSNLNDQTNAFQGEGFQSLNNITSDFSQNISSFNGEGLQSLNNVTSDLNETMGSISESMVNQKTFADLPSTANTEAAQRFMSAYNLTPPAPPPPQVITKEASITVRFQNTPEGTRIEKDPGSQAPVSIDRGINPLGA